MAQQGSYKPGEKKISAVLVEMAKPFVDLIDESTTEEQLISQFTVVVTVWNATVFDKVRNTTEYTAKLRELIKGTPPAPLVEALLLRKQELFGDDLRAVGEHRVTLKDGVMNVHATAHEVSASSVR